MTAATHELGRMADELDAQVAQFKLAGDESSDRSLRTLSESASSTLAEEEESEVAAEAVRPRSRPG